ncbi:MAG: SRPBCC family protein [Lysobacter sp.]|nr:SRPBCC family protein [Lysobacter sp.]
MVKIIAIVIVVVLIGVLAFATTKPDTFRVERSTRIDAPPEKIDALIDDFHRWGAWSPWEKLDPLQRTHTGAASGVGAIYAWDGNSRAGAGSMQITKASARKVAIKLDFIKPFASHNIADFALQPPGDATHVTWSMQGPAPFVSR